MKLERVYRTLDQAYAELTALARELRPPDRSVDPPTRLLSLGDDDDAETSDSGEYFSVR